MNRPPPQRGGWDVEDAVPYAGAHRAVTVGAIHESPADFA